MKKFLLGLLLTIFSFGGIAQTVIQQDWKVENPTDWGSFYWGVTRTQYPDSHGKYFYYVYFYSNSLFSTKKNDGVNYDKAVTYIKNIDIVLYDYKYVSGKKVFNSSIKLNLPYVTCDYYYDDLYYAAWFWSYNPYAKFKLTFEKASPFDYSSY